MANYAILEEYSEKEDFMDSNNRTDQNVNKPFASAEMSEDEMMAEMQKEEEKFMRWVRRRIILNIAIVVLFVAAIAVGGIWIYRNNIAPDTSEYDTQFDKLAHQKQQLLYELDKLGPDSTDKLGNTSYMSFLFTTVDAPLYTDAYPIMSSGDYQLAGVMALSPTELPGLNGKITNAQFAELLENGWCTALYWDGTGDLGEYLATMKTTLEAREIEFPKSVVFKSGTYKLEYDELLHANGIENAIQSGDEALPTRESTEPVGVWHPGYIGWKASGRTNLKLTIEKDGGYALFEICFNNSPENTVTSYFELPGESANSRTEAFKKMVNLFKTSIEAGDIEVIGTDEVRAKVEKYYGDLSDSDKENMQLRRELNEQIAEIDRQMTQLYHEYFG